MMCPDGTYQDLIQGMPCMNSGDCTMRYSYSECSFSLTPMGMAPIGGRMCYCRCGYRFDYSSNACINRDSCWYCSSGVILAIIITILVVVIIVAVFTIPTCALVSCMG